jgi:hypothetical protein
LCSANAVASSAGGTSTVTAVLPTTVRPGNTGQVERTSQRLIHAGSHRHLVGVSPPLIAESFDVNHQNQPIACGGKVHHAVIVLQVRSLVDAGTVSCPAEVDPSFLTSPARTQAFFP